MHFTKYGNKKKEYNGMLFDSIRELNRWKELELLQRAGEISGLQRQVAFELIPSQRDKNGKLLERACDYIADFAYKDKDGEYVVEDAKGQKTAQYIIKRKLMLKEHGIRIREV